MIPATDKAKGVLFGVGAYALWGVLPAYFALLAPVGPWELLSWRVIFGFVFCASTLLWVSHRSVVKKYFRGDRTFWLMGLAGHMIFLNWVFFFLGLTYNMVVEIAMGYFMNPITVSLLGVIVLKEKMRPLQWVAIAISISAILYLVISYGQVPWIALGITFTWGLYSLTKRVVGKTIEPVAGMLVESIWLLPISFAILIFIGSTSGIMWGSEGLWNTLGIMLCGVGSALPLLLYAASARLITLVSMALLQFISPILAFLSGVFIFQEEMPFERWVGVGILWVAITVIVIDTVLEYRQDRKQKLLLRSAELI